MRLTAIRSIVGDRLLGAGLIGGAVTALCCVTPVLVVTLGALGLSAWVSGLDAVLLPLFGLFAVMTGYAVWRRCR